MSFALAEERPSGPPLTLSIRHPFLAQDRITYSAYKENTFHLHSMSVIRIFGEQTTLWCGLAFEQNN